LLKETNSGPNRESTDRIANPNIQAPNSNKLNRKQNTAVSFNRSLRSQNSARAPKIIAASARPSQNKYPIFIPKNGSSIAG
jgi:hypothetical protein